MWMWMGLEQAQKTSPRTVLVQRMAVDLLRSAYGVDAIIAIGRAHERVLGFSCT